MKLTERVTKDVARLVARVEFLEARRAELIDRVRREAGRVAQLEVEIYRLRHERRVPR